MTVAILLRRLRRPGGSLVSMKVLEFAVFIEFWFFELLVVVLDCVRDYIPDSAIS